MRLFFDAFYLHVKNKKEVTFDLFIFVFLKAEDEIYIYVEIRKNKTRREK